MTGLRLSLKPFFFFALGVGGPLPPWDEKNSYGLGTKNAPDSKPRAKLS